MRLLIAAFALTGCTRINEVSPTTGKAVNIASISSDATDVRITTPAGTTITIGSIDNAAIHTALGQSIGVAGTAIATAGILK